MARDGLNARAKSATRFSKSGRRPLAVKCAPGVFQHPGAIALSESRISAQPMTVKLMPYFPPHSCEQIRDVVIDVLLKRDPNVNQFSQLLLPVAARLEQWSPIPHREVSLIDCLHDDDKALVLEVFWDLFRQGIITLGTDTQWNSGWPWFRLSRFGTTALARQNPYRFHDTGSYIALVKGAVPDLSREAELYLEEACATFYADCLLSSTVMLGVAAEAEFLRLVDVAATSAAYGSFFFVCEKGEVRQIEICCVSKTT